jgi:hypothetical protein
MTYFFFSFVIIFAFFKSEKKGSWPSRGGGKGVVIRGFSRENP